MRPKAIATLGTGPMRSLVDLTLPSFHAFAAEHGYDVVVGSGLPESGRPKAWDKVPFLLDLLESYEVVLWLDSDAVVVDPSRDILDEVPSTAWQAVVEHGHSGHSEPNTGIWVLRSTDEAKAFLQEVWDQEQLIDHQWWENAAVVRLLGYGPEGQVPGSERWLAGTHFLPGEWNVLAKHSGYDSGRIRHYAAMSNDARMVHMAADIADLTDSRDRPWRHFRRWWLLTVPRARRKWARGVRRLPGASADRHA